MAQKVKANKVKKKKERKKVRWGKCYIKTRFLDT